MSDLTYTIELQTKAMRQLKSLEKQTRERIVRAVDKLAKNPRASNCKPLEGFTGIRRLRIGDYRVIYQIRDSELVILVVEVGHRKEVYRGL